MALRRRGLDNILRARRWSIVLVLLALAPAASMAQQARGEGAQEIRLLQEAEAREKAGDLGGAEERLRVLLERNPASLSGLLALERVLRAQGRTENVVVHVERLLELDPGSNLGYQTLLRVYSELNDMAGLERAAERWINASPERETPYREVAKVWETRGEVDRAIEVLERGRAGVDREDALAFELGAVHAAHGDPRQAVREWDRAIGPDARGFSLVRRRLGTLPDGGARLLRPLIDALVAQPTTRARQEAAVELAVDAGLGGRAGKVAKRIAGELGPRERRNFFVDVARSADGARLPKLAYWAYSELLEEGDDDDRMLAVRSRVADLALAVGDTARAREYYRELEQAYEAGSGVRRHAAARGIELTAREGNIEQALGQLDRFRAEYPDAGPELDGVLSTVAGVLVDAGDADRAGRLLRGVPGPQASMARGRIALERGDIKQARAEFLSAASSLEGAQATETIALATLLGQLSPQGGGLLARAMIEAAAGRPHEAVALLASESAELPGAERTRLLDFAATMADRTELHAEAERIRRVLIVEYPASPETPAALLAVARALIARAEALDEAQALLERLVLDHPRSPLAPQARRELDRLRDTVPRS